MLNDTIIRMQPTGHLPARQPTRRIVAAWRRLTGGPSTRDSDRPTLIACSGGADSSALLLALATTPAPLTVAHIIHDMRRPQAAQADALRVQELAATLGLPFVTDSIAARPHGGNLEAVSRQLRYAALATLARSSGCRFIVTGHHAGDQAETLLMRLMRGVGSRGVASIRSRRTLAEGIHVIRPMLALNRNDAEAICTAAQWQWLTDATNTDPNFGLRSAIRHRLLPLIEELRPGSTGAIARSTDVLGRHASAIEYAAKTVQALAARNSDNGGLSWKRECLRTVPAVVLMAALRNASREPGGAAFWRTVATAARDKKEHERIFEIGAVRIRIDANTLNIRWKGEPSTNSGSDAQSHPTMPEGLR